MYLDGHTPRLGALRGDDIVDLRALAAARQRELHAGSVLELIDLGDEGLRDVRDLLAEDLDAAAEAEGHIRPLAGATLLPPLNPPRGNVIAIGLNYKAHAEESARAQGVEYVPLTTPTAFTKAQTSINGPNGDIPLHANATQKVDWEVELGVVIGSSGVNIPPEQARDHVFGYMVVNDVSARDLQFGWGGQFFKGKSLDGFCPIGPWIVTADEISDPQNLRLWLAVNGETMQDANTGDMIFPVDDLVVHLSTGMTLPAGTLIATGTPSGVGNARKPPVFLKEGDIVEAGVDGIGVLRNRVVSRPTTGLGYRQPWTQHGIDI
jgi:2-keto-4-pentenoate hydratase/2-oxohepta-3-ene-1,7-dioic acid hydratase in catechol pathway